jgi:FtsP/CotA-like multicopper oxidase with cupredoxin domain
MRSSPAASSALAAILISAAALLLASLSASPAAQRQVPSPVPEPATLDVDLVITGLGAAGEPATHHYYNPSMIVARKGDRVRVRFRNLTFASHGIEFEGYGVRTGVLPGGPRGIETVEFVADRPGVFRFKCYVPYEPAAGMCSPDHDTQIGYLVVLDAPR